VHAEKTEQSKGKFSKVYPTDDQWDTLSDLSRKLSEASKAVQDNIRVLKESRSERAWKESEEHRSQVQSSRGDLFAKGRLKQPAIFRRSIVTIFEGVMKDSKFDCEDVRLWFCGNLEGGETTMLCDSPSKPIDSGRVDPVHLGFNTFRLKRVAKFGWKVLKHSILEESSG